MLRLAVLVLILANAGYYAWHEGWLRGVGLAPTEQSEPQRLAQQIQPESLRVLGTPNGTAPAPGSTASATPTNGASAANGNGNGNAAPAAPAEATTCLQAGVFDQKQADTLRPLVTAALPAGSWSLENTPIASRWMVYMGRFADEEALEKKRTELRARKVPFDRPGAALEPGLSLGRFSTEEAAERALATLGNQGVRTARVVQERADAVGYVLRVPQATEAQRTSLEGLRTALGSKTLRACGSSNG